jgi:hypothetical protein
MKLKIVFLLLLCFGLQHSMAQKNEEETTKSNLFSRSFKSFFGEDDSLKKKDGFFVLPLLYYTPDTRFAYGAAGVYYFSTAKLVDENPHPTRLSYVRILGDYTQNKQFDLWTNWNIFTDQEKWLFKGDLRYRRFPDSFYGIGNDTKDEDREKYSYDYYSIKALFMRRIGEHTFAGFDLLHENEYNFSYDDPEGSLALNQVEGARGGIGSAVGSVITFDSRDNVVNAFKGQYAQFSAYFFLPELASDFDFVFLDAVYNTYHELSPGHVLATNAVAQFNFGGVPFLDQAKVGNDDLLRGYARNRFRDDHFVAGQAEYRFPLYKRLGAVAFAGIGDVFSRPDDLSLDLLKYSYGGGLRFTINKKERLNIRFDYGFGRDENAFYIMVTEAF